MKDTWRLTNRVTLNLGARWERQHSYLPAQSAESARDFPDVFPGGSFPELDVGTWSRVVPRLGVAWDVGGNAVVKATVGQYNYRFGDTFADGYNQNATSTATFLWHDLNGDELYQAGEVNLDLNGPDFIGLSGASSAILNPDLREPTTWETTASFEQELTENMGVRAMYVYRRLVDYFDDLNILRPYRAYDTPMTRRDPGPDGILDTGDDAGSVTFYDYQAAYHGADFEGDQLTNSPNVDRFHTIELMLTKRSSGGGWFKDRTSSRRTTGGSTRASKVQTTKCSSLTRHGTGVLR